MDSVPGALPDVAERTAHQAPLEAVQESVPAPPLVMEMSCGGGTAAPAVDWEARGWGAATRDAGGAGAGRGRARGNRRRRLCTGTRGFEARPPGMRGRR